MATYTWSQLEGEGVSQTETITAELQKIELLIKTPAYNEEDGSYTRRSDADVGQCSLIIETLNLGMNPEVVAQGNPPFGPNPSLDYFTPASGTDWPVAACFYTELPGFSAQVTTFESLGITHNLQYTPGANLLGTAWQTGYLPAGRKIVTFNFPIDVGSGANVGTTNIYFRPPVNTCTEYKPASSRYGSIRFRGIGGISLVTTVSSF